jgi:tetratricopeptide (TPR) repeat protein
MVYGRAVGLILLVLVAGCGVPVPAIKPAEQPRYFTNLIYAPAAARYRQVVEQKFRERDLSYILSLLSYGICLFYDLQLDEARRAFFAAYKVDAGERPEAAKIYDWLVVDSRTVYKLRKRERELVHFYLGRCYLMQDNLEEALVEFKKLRQYDQDASRLPVVNFYLGLIYELLGKFDDARIEYRALAAMADSGSEIGGLSRQLLEQLERADTVDTGTIELIVQVEHQSAGVIGRTEVRLDSGPVVAVLPALMDSFPVQLSRAEAARKAAQEAGAKAARLGLRFLGAVLMDRVLPGRGRELADDIADITLGKESENRDLRAWGYAPLNFSFTRLRLPAGTERVRLVFYNPAGTMQGYCDYPLTGENRRAGLCRDRNHGRRTLVLVAGLAEEFFGY